MNQLINQEANAANPNSGMLFDPNQRMLAPNVVGEGFPPEAPPDLVEAVKSGAMTPQQAQQMMGMQPAPGNPSLAMQAMSPAPMATYNPLMDDPMLMMMAQQSMAPPRGLLY